jgi:pimeloyl-ACP methyl ester carboxylesterase
MAVAHLNGTQLFYVEAGQGRVPCLVMHGGLGGDHTCLHPWLDPLGDVMHLLYYDHRGNGRSGRPCAITWASRRSPSSATPSEDVSPWSTHCDTPSTSAT